MVVVGPWLAVVGPFEWLAVVAPPPPGCDAAGADEWAAGAGAECAAGAGALGFFCPQARLGTATRLRTKSHLATLLEIGWVSVM